MRLTDNAQKEKHIMSTINTLAHPCAWFKKSLIEIPAKCDNGTMSSYDYYSIDSHHSDTNINGHKLQMTYTLRYDTAIRNAETQAWELRDVPEAYITVTMTLTPNATMQRDHVQLEQKYQIKFETEGYEERIDEAITRFNQVIQTLPLPSVSFDFWKYVGTAAPAFEKVTTAFKKLSWIADPE
jgi:hypothetical protein